MKRTKIECSDEVSYVEDIPRPVVAVNPGYYDKAREKVEEILASPQKNPLPDNVIAKLEDIMRRADDELKE